MKQWNFEQILNAEGNYIVLLLNCDHVRNSDVNLNVQSLWNKGKLRVLVDGGANCLYEQNKSQTHFRLPDIVCGDFDSIKPTVKQFYAEQGVLVHELPDQDDTDFTKSVQFAIQHYRNLDKQPNLDFVVAIWSTGGRLDQCLSCINTLQKFAHQIPIFLWDPRDSLSWIVEPCAQHRIKCNPKSKWCSLVPVGHPCSVTTSGFRWNLNKDTLRFGGLISSSNEFSPQHEYCSIQTDHPILFSMDVNYQ